MSLSVTTCAPFWGDAMSLREAVGALLGDAMSLSVTLWAPLWVARFRLQGCACGGSATLRRFTSVRQFTCSNLRDEPAKRRPGSAQRSRWGKWGHWGLW